MQGALSTSAKLCKAILPWLQSFCKTAQGSQLHLLRVLLHPGAWEICSQIRTMEESAVFKHFVEQEENRQPDLQKPKLPERSPAQLSGSQGKFSLKGNKNCPDCMWLIHIDLLNVDLQHGENGSNRNSVLPVSFEASMKISWCIEPLARLASLATKVFDATLGPAPWEVEGPGVQHLQFVKSLWRASHTHRSVLQAV